MIDQAICELAPVVGVRAACAALGESRARHYRRHRRSPPPPRPERIAAPQPRALSEVERKEIRRVLNCRRARRRGAGDGLRQAPRRRRLPGLGPHHVPDPARARRGRRPPAPRHPSRPGEARARRHEDRTRSTRGTSPSCTARRSGPTTTSTRSSTSTAATSPGGCWLEPSGPASPRR